MIRSGTSRLNATRFAIALLAFGCAFASALTGLHLTHMLPEHHLRRRQSLDRAVARCCCSAWATGALTSESRLPRHCESFRKRGASHKARTFAQIKQLCHLHSFFNDIDNKARERPSRAVGRCDSARLWVPNGRVVAYTNDGRWLNVFRGKPSAQNAFRCRRPPPDRNRRPSGMVRTGLTNCHGRPSTVALRLVPGRL